MEENKTLPQEPAAFEVVDIQFRPGQKTYYFSPQGLTLKAGDRVIIDTARGPEYGVCTQANHTVTAQEVFTPLRPVLRLATAQDEKQAQENRAREARAFKLCQQKIADHGLDMQLVSAEFAFDGSKIIFCFTADERVDFRELVKGLAGSLHTRVELRQIGVRDKAKLVGGLGICGRPFCCATFLDDFQPVSIKMAKTQSLSLNPTKISGTCGRLMCCLKYEQDTYESLIRSAPKAESFVDTPDGRGTVTEVDVLRQRVKVRMEDRPEVITVHPNEDIAVLRSGKAKKTDPPIPADLAPISGGGRRTRLESTQAPVLEPIRFRYSTEEVAPQQAPEAQPAAPEAPQEEQKKTGRSRRRRRGPRPEAAEKPQAPQAEPKPRPQKSKPKAPEAAEKPQAPKEQKPGEGAHRRRRNHRGHRKPGPKPEGN